MGVLRIVMQVNLSGRKYGYYLLRQTDSLQSIRYPYITVLSWL